MERLSSIVCSVVLLYSFVLFTGCNNDDTTSTVAPSSSLISGIELQNMDTSISPQDDFYTYVNGNWINNTTIPADKSSYSAFSEIYDKTQTSLQEIVTEILAKEPQNRSVSESKIADLYTSYMDTTRLESLGITPLQSTLDMIDAVQSYNDLTAVMGKVIKEDITTPITFYVGADANDSEINILYLSQDGLGLPDRDYYLNSDTTFTEIQNKYKTYIKDIYALSGKSGDAEVIAQNVYDLEYQLAQIEWNNEDNRDALKTYNKYTLSDANALSGNFNLELFLQNIGISNLNTLIIAEPSYFSDLGTLYETIPLDTWKAYLTFHALSDYARFLNKEFVDLNFDFYATTLNGITEQRERSKLALDLINEVIGELLGKLYVEKYFPARAKEQMEILVENVLTAYDRSIDSLTWMEDSTKAAARDKLHKITTKIGYPETFESYDTLEIKDDDLVGNYMRYVEYSINKEIADIGQAVDHTKWGMLPQTVNAYYSPTSNEIVFPSAILQPPFFNMDADMAINYGAIGSVIGHEVSHAFDDAGSKYDGDGNLNDWWTPEDAQKFAALGDLLVAQYDQYEPLPGHFINGRLTLGENMADLNGVSIGYKAYEIFLGDETAPVLDGFTGKERFFIGWAQVWRNKMREEELLRRLIVDPHSPAKYRVNGVFTNIDSFYDAFDVTSQGLMYRPAEDRITIW